MIGAELTDNTVTMVALTLLPLGAGFLAWVVRELSKVSTTNARVAERLEQLERRMERLEDATWRPAWGPTTNPPTTK